MDDGGDWITARYLLSSVLGRNPLVVDYVDEESFPVDDDPPSPSSSSSGGKEKDPRRATEAPPPVRAPAGVAGTVCAVCTEEIAAADAVVRLPCAHWYHHGCIAPWLGIRPTCPMCRAELPPPPTEPDEEAGGESGAGRRVKPAPALGVAAAAGTSAGASARVTAAAAVAQVRREVSYEYLAVAGGVVSG